LKSKDKSIFGFEQMDLTNLFPSQKLLVVNRFDEISKSFDSLPDQRPCTCGAFALSYIFSSLGFVRHEGNDLLAEDYLAHLASVVIEESEVATSEAVGLLVSRGLLLEDEARKLFPKVWYRYPVQSSQDEEMLGTSPSGIARAIALGTQGALVSLPIPARRGDGSIQLDEVVWHELLNLLALKIDVWNWHAILNYQLTLTLNPAHLAYSKENLQLKDPTSVIPLDDWDAGHFVGVGGLWTGSNKPWLLLLDSAKNRGFNGYQPQPGELLRQGLIRRDGRGGGIHLILESGYLEKALRDLRALEIEFMMWSNGSPEPTDWVWKMGS
jgi:hypothetical protein